MKTMDLSSFDPNGPAQADYNIFGLPSTEENSRVILFPVPWEVTVSYHTGTSRAPESIFEASQQIDLYDAVSPRGWEKGFFMKEIDKDILLKSDCLRKEAALYIDFLAEGGQIEENEFMQNSLRGINKGCEELCDWVKAETGKLLAKNKLVGLVGGDHSTPLGYYKSLSEKYASFGILHLDAHLDLRKDYESFIGSHASIMYNALTQIPQIKKLVSVGGRDYCQEELDFAESQGDRVNLFFDSDLKEGINEGKSWKSIADEIIERLPENVYLSFDIDGLDPKLCPHTGTPVMGGLEWHQADYLIRQTVESGRKLIGFDLVEVGHQQTDWDANVGARILFRLCNLITKEV